MANTIKAVRGMIALGDIPVGVYGHPQDPDGYMADFKSLGVKELPLEEMALSVVSMSATNKLAFAVVIACLVECVMRRADTVLCDELERIKRQDPKSSFVLDSSQAIMQMLGCSTPEDAILKIKDLGSSSSKIKPSNKESQISDRIAQELNGAREVVTPCGNIDVLTDNEVIEVKAFSGWKSAIGQVCAYATFYPDKIKRIHLFDCNDKDLSIVKSVAHPLDIVVSQE